MNITTQIFRLPNYISDCFLIHCQQELTRHVSEKVRKLVRSCIDLEYPVVYLDLRDVKNIDLSGINEVVHSHYTLKQFCKKLVLVYRKDSEVQKWIKTAGLYRFIDTAIVPEF